jgi:hypothetical protein
VIRVVARNDPPGVTATSHSFFFVSGLRSQKGLLFPDEIESSRLSSPPR